MAFGQSGLRRLYAGKIQIALLFSCDEAVYFHFGLGGHGVEGTAGGSNSGRFDGAGLFNQGIFYLFDDGCYLRDIVNLSVEHGSGLMFKSVSGDDVQVFVVTFLGHDTDNTARANIQGENALVLFDRFGRRRFDDVDGLHHFRAEFFLDRWLDRLGFFGGTGGFLRGGGFGSAVYICCSFLYCWHKKTPYD